MKTTFVINHRPRENSDEYTKSLDLKKRLLEIYEDCSVVLIEDSPRLKRLGNVNKWIERYLTCVDDGLIVKIDPDTEALKKADLSGENIFAAVRYDNMKTYVRQWPMLGVIGWPYEIRKSVLDSKILRDSFYESPIFGEHENRIYVDIIMKLGLKIDDRKDFCCGKSRQVTEQTTFKHK